MKKGDKKTSYTQEQIDECKVAFEGGMSITNISKTMEIPTSTIYTWKNNDWKPGSRFQEKDTERRRKYTRRNKTQKPQTFAERLYGAGNETPLEEIKDEIIHVPKNGESGTTPIESHQDKIKRQDAELDAFVDKCISVFTGYRDLKRRLASYEAQVTRQNSTIVDLTEKIQKTLRPQS